MKFFDNHTHSQFSPDSKTTVEELVSSASNIGMSGISITDHLDLGAPKRIKKDKSAPEPLPFVFSPAEQQEEINAVAQKFDIDVFKGIEIGLQPAEINNIRNFIAPYNFDVVIASIHFVDGEDPYYGNYYLQKDYTRAYRRMLELIYQTSLSFPDFDILGHFDYIVRYSPYKEKEIKFSDFGDYLEPILRFLAHEGKALEINTKTYIDYNGHTPLLDAKILKMFKLYGGEMISLGSDSHDANMVANNFEKYAEIIKKSGFKYLVYFKERKPCFYPIK